MQVILLNLWGMSYKGLEIEQNFLPNQTNIKEFSPIYYIMIYKIIQVIYKTIHIYILFKQVITWLIKEVM